MAQGLLRVARVAAAVPQRVLEVLRVRDRLAVARRLQGEVADEDEQRREVGREGRRGPVECCRFIFVVDFLLALDDDALRDLADEVEPLDRRVVDDADDVEHEVAAQEQR